jgi:hypothetical protein
MNDSLHPSIFISHISEDAILAQTIKDMLVCALNIDSNDIFVSSDIESITEGYWFDQIWTNINECMVGIILCSQHSITKPWIPFEFGALLMSFNVRYKNVAPPIFPICYGNLNRSNVPEPIKTLQAWELLNNDHLMLIVKEIAKLMEKDLSSNFDISNYASKFKRQNENLHASPNLVIRIVNDKYSYVGGDYIYLQGVCTSSKKAKLSIHFCIGNSVDIDSFNEGILEKEVNIRDDDTFEITVILPKCLKSGTYFLKIVTAKGLWDMVFIVIKDLDVLSTQHSRWRVTKKNSKKIKRILHNLFGKGEYI